MCVCVSVAGGLRLGVIGPAIPTFLFAGLGQQVLHARGWSAIANVACKSELPLTDNKVSFVSIFTSNMSLSESGRLMW